MTEKLDPYSELNVSRDATDPEIRRAYKKRVKKTHPDGGGDPDAFKRTVNALAVLTDPTRRDKFDRTGSIDEEKVDNDRATALQIIESQIAGLVNRFISGGYNPADDPRQIDVPAGVKVILRASIENAHHAISEGEKHVAVLHDIARRFTVKGEEVERDPIGRGFARQIAHAEQQIESIKDSIRCHELAIKIADCYSFEKNAPAYDPYAMPNAVRHFGIDFASMTPPRGR